MHDKIIYSLTLALSLLLVVGVVGCAAAANPPSTASTPVTMAETPTTSAATSTSTPTSTSAATSTTAATSAATRAATSAATSAAVVTPITVATLPAPTGNPSGSADKVFATAIRVSPPQPVAGPDYVTFYVAFNNQSGKSQALKWYVKIWSPDNATQSFGETALQVNDIPNGTSEIASASNWRTNPISCQPFTARVYWVNSDVNFGNPVEFKKPDGSPGSVASFQVCPATPKP